ncbi:DNA polymerase II [Aestuariibacter sp. A3R04]|uniref:DNA polymerase II n=1 Tax=Aestuariibacter sp. A3R04 TaxID=2841571 RepID=UPI001C09D473|nr:DNA polymerase II [Aestuariibacter sp. A3R04]MBU3021164.1 DNA polymerase II [Aestuariibacter sp. A3R04]
MPPSPSSQTSGKGLILSRRIISQGNKDLIELWLATDSGAVRLLTPPQSNVCFVKTVDYDKALHLIQAHNLAVKTEETTLKTLDQHTTVLLRSANERVQSALRRLASANALVLHEADIKSVDRFLMERFAYGTVAYTGQRTPQGVINARVKGTQFKPSLRSVSVDIECDENENLYSIAVVGDTCQQVLLNIENTQCPTTSTDTFQCYCFDSEKATLAAFETLINATDPDVILGWNIKQFDFAVLSRIAARHNMQLKLGRHGALLNVKAWSDSAQVTIDIPGRCIIDGIEALKTMTYTFERFSLDHVANVLLGTGKLISSDDQLGEIKALYHRDPLTLCQYNYQDCVLVNRIAQKTRMIDFLVLRGTLTGLDPGRPGGSVAAFINVYLPKLHRAGYVCGVRPDNGGLASPGGYVMPSRPGLYDNVLVLDFKSLYPSIIRTFLIDPLGLAEGLRDSTNTVEGYKGARFSRQFHFLPDIIANLWYQRDEAKREGDSARSQAIKIIMNSFYGVLGSGGCPFYDPRLASSITMRGHDIMQTTANWIRAEGYEVIYGDTDSIFVHIEKTCSTSTAKQTGEQLQELVNRKWQQELANNYNLECHLEIEFETHFSRFFMPTIRGSEEGSKKRYAGLVENDGKSELIFKGLESVRSDWTPLARQFQAHLFRQVFANRPVDDYIKSTLSALREGKLDDRLVYAKRLRKPLADYDRTQPPHVKAARQADARNADQAKPLRYQHRTTVRYIMTLSGPQVTEYVTSPIDYEHYVEKQIRPIAESILPLTGQQFEDINNHQMGLFDNS